MDVDDTHGSSGRTGGCGGDSDTFGTSRKEGDETYGSSRRFHGDDDGDDDDDAKFGFSGRTVDTGYGSGMTSGAGYGNKSSSHGEQEMDEFKPSEGLGDSMDTYSGGHDTYGSGATGGAGYGNKSSSYGEEIGEYHGSQGMGDRTEPYSGGSDTYGSGTVGGAGYGNKTGSYEDDKSKGDSTAGKIMEKVGGMFHKEDLERKGHEKRAQAGHDDGDY